MKKTKFTSRIIPSMWYASFASIKKFFHLSLITVNDHYNITEDNNIIWGF